MTNKKNTKDTNHIDDPLLTLIQEVYFDLCDVRNNRSLTFRKGAEKPEEYDNAQEWVEEQRDKLAEIESRVEELLKKTA